MCFKTVKVNSFQELLLRVLCIPYAYDLKFPSLFYTKLYIYVRSLQNILK